MIPERFCIEYPSRVLTLLEELEPAARALDLSTTFVVSLAMPMLVIPLERLKSGHKFFDARFDSRLHEAFEGHKAQRFADTPFWVEADRLKWRFAHLRKDGIDEPCSWCDLQGRHPMSYEAVPDSVPFNDIIFTMRHALSHGCVVYLDEFGQERPGRRVTQVAFISKADKGAPEGSDFRLVAVEEQALRRFLSAWCRWLQGFGLSPSLRLAA